MTEPEKVIKGLECCTNSDMSMCLDECPYHTDGCSGGIKMMRDALSLLKAQEPRVMTLEEMQKIKEHDFIWTEGRTDGMIYCNEVVQVCKTGDSLDGVSEISLNAPTTIIFIEMDQYNHRWRCWTSRPTDEQREKVKWE